ncbi:MAG: malto-oligosyltrehalose synthase [Pseudomonadota bacterium]
MPVEPRAAYRVQLRPGFGLDAGAQIAPYLAKLGVSHFFASPYLQAAPGSQHGYDIVDPTRVNAELGGEDAHARLCAALAAHGLAQMLDIVPNHMAVAGRANPWWWDVLEHGPSSRYATFFDVDWESPEQRLQNKVLLPVLGDQYGRVLEAGEIRLRHAGGELTLHYHEHAFPVDPATLEPLLATAAVRCGSEVLGFLADACGRLPQATATGRGAVDRRQRNAMVIHDMLARLCHDEPVVAAAIDAAVTHLNSEPDALDALLDRQNYRLAYWRTAGRDLGYRRFFDINTLAGLRVEDEEVFEQTHGRVVDWVARGALAALRVDHPDGLRNPAQYFYRLRKACPQAWIVAEKILSPDESLPDDWPIAGTTGYEFLNLATGLFVDPAGEAPLTALYAELCGETADFATIAQSCKREVLTELLGSELNRLTALLLTICERHRRHRDYTRHELHEALRETAVCMPVYRTYVRYPDGVVADADRRCIDAAIAQVIAARPDLDAELLRFLRDLLLLRVPGALEGELAMRFQQLTGPATAKGIEDTALYRYHRLVCLNEVGGDPGHFGTRPDRFHAFCSEVQQRRPQTLLTTSNHDTKRSGDVRARLALLSEIPAHWAAAVQRWIAQNARHRRHELPDRNTEYLLYQTLVGTWPIARARLDAYLLKAVREAKQHTSWLRPEPAYEEALQAFTAAVLADEAFCADLAAFVSPLVWPGRINGLAQTLLKLTAPGVPEIYQGTELWNLSLVDPDNRRPVDFALRERLLDALPQLAPEELVARADDGLPKLAVVAGALALRREHPAPFGVDGGFLPLKSAGAKAGHALAYLRGGEVAVIVPRLVLGLGGDWADTTLALPRGRWRNRFTGEHIDGGPVRLAELLRRFPVALLAREEPAA